MKQEGIPTAGPINRIVEALSKLPGIGPKSAQRLAYYLLQADLDRVKELAEAIGSLRQQVCLCSSCLNIANSSICHICDNPGRDQSMICVVEKPLDIIPLEKTRAYNGLYHVLHGTIAPSDGIGPDQLKVKELLSRLQNGSVREVILATNPTTEGEATALYLKRLISTPGIRVTRLARGLPYGAELEYADQVTIVGALEGRQELT